jgi:nucleotide-binding universal stress UspA family protein
MKTILLPTDFSAAANNAANYAANMALAVKADLFLLHVYDTAVGYSEVPLLIDPEELKESAENEICKLREQLIRNTGGKIKIGTSVNLGTFFDELESVCDKVNPYAVIMGNQGTSTTLRLLFGSHTVQAMKHLQWPLITVPKGVRYPGMKRIGLACDFKKAIDETTIDEIKLLVNDFNAELHVLNIEQQKTYDPEFGFESGLLQVMLFELKPCYHFFKNENIDEGIMEFTEKNNIDLLIMMPKRHSMLDKFMHKSHTKQLVLYSHVPVMALHQ